MAPHTHAFNHLSGIPTRERLQSGPECEWEGVMIDEVIGTDGNVVMNGSR